MYAVIIMNQLPTYSLHNLIRFHANNNELLVILYLYIISNSRYENLFNKSVINLHSEQCVPVRSQVQNRRVSEGVPRRAVVQLRDVEFSV